MLISSILVIDDEPTNFDVIETLLANQGYDLNYSASGAEAIASLATFAPDVILLDVMMPDMDGIEVCRQIKAMSQWQAVPIIMVTALNSKEDLARCLDAGADDFISKPINGLELRARVRSMLRIKRQYDRIQSLSQLQRKTINLLRENLQILQGNLTANFPREMNTSLTGILVALQMLEQAIDPNSQAALYELVQIAYRSSQRLETFSQKFLQYLQLELAANNLSEDTAIDQHSSDDVNSLDTKLGDDNDSLDEARSSSITGDKRIKGIKANAINISFTEKSQPNFVHSLAIVEIAEVIAEKKYKRLADLRCRILGMDLAVDPKHLKSIINELVDNAFKFSPAQTPVILRSECRDDRLHLWINNQGLGMTQEQIAKVGAFVQFEHRTYEEQGIGLGLAIAQKAIALYGGHLRLTSIYQKELTAYFTLPLATENDVNKQET
ncbi:response regulator [Trichothermofontia sichuanensis B231]|uniref:hybrid sensor histidine kinase/response regulator n=1 Tax=Trichothermofontia sichuanensis TaxID=3045816 RepID=UPI002245CE21|nr:response regulator [Trichothermofontia sichuanensis]UZQ56070.1 response regulator [Trichothermofontia sichuanensis B231]